MPHRIVDGRLELHTTRPLEDLQQLAQGGLVWKELRIQQPGLEAVFLALTGRELRDD
jgi:hypothetical protein